jgi:hypothetical protein
MRHFRATLMKKNILTFITILFFSCSTKTDKQDEIYFVIKHPDKTVKDTGDIPPPPLPPMMFYGRHNFILADTNRIFYHDNYAFYSCGTGIDFSKPPKLFLSTDSLIEIKIDVLNSFLQKNLPDSMVNDKWVTANISSHTDTIKSKSFKIITDYFKVKNIRRYGIRNWTEEEKFAVTAKIGNKFYDPKSSEFIIGLDTKFIPPTDTTREN